MVKIASFQLVPELQWRRRVGVLQWIGPAFFRVYKHFKPYFHIWFGNEAFLYIWSAVAYSAICASKLFRRSGFGTPSRSYKPPEEKDEAPKCMILLAHQWISVKLLRFFIATPVVFPRFASRPRLNATLTWHDWEMAMLLLLLCELAGVPC